MVRSVVQEIPDFKPTHRIVIAGYEMLCIDLNGNWEITDVEWDDDCVTAHNLKEIKVTFRMKEEKNKESEEYLDERISEVIDALTMICAAGYREGAQASVIEPQKALIKKRLSVIDDELGKRGSMTLAEYQRKADRTLKKQSKRNAIIDYAFGIVGEAGETVNAVKKFLFHDHDNIDEIVDELGDVLWYLSALASTIGVSLDEIAKKNNEKLTIRYPDGFSEERSRNRDLDLEGAGFEI